MKGVILDKGEKGFSLFGRVFDNINVLSEKYNWLISYPVCCPSDKELFETFTENYVWLSGKKLKEILHTEDFLWIWGVLSGFPENITLEDILKNDSIIEDIGKIYHQAEDLEKYNAL